MTTVQTQWKITAVANMKQARTEMIKFAQVAQQAGTSIESMYANVSGAPVAKSYKNITSELDKMNVALNKGTVKMNTFNRYWKQSANLVRRSKQLQNANYVAISKANGAITEGAAVMQRFNTITASGAERLGLMNYWFRQTSRHAINAAKNIQWSGRQITVGFTLPFGLAMAGAAASFLKFEEQLVRFRKVFNAELSNLTVEEAEAKVTTLANTMARQLGIARSEVMETSAVFAQMGYNVPDIERLTRATTELAMLGETDATAAADLLRAYSASGFVDSYLAEGRGRTEDEFEDYIKNLLNAIENNTGLSIAKMVEAGMGQLIPLFEQTGIGLGIGESILAGMTEALGGRANEAVTALKAIIQRVYDESTETTEQFSLIGVDIESLQEEYKSDFVGLITELATVLENNPAIQQNNKALAETFGNLFGIRQANRAIAGLKSVAGAFDETGAAVNDYGRALRSFENDAEIARRSQAELDAQAESFGGRLRRLKEDILITASEIGQTFLEVAMPLGEVIRDILNWINNLSESTKRFWMTVGGIIAGIGGFLTTAGVLGQAFIMAARGLSYFLPKLKPWVEEMVKNKIAASNVDTALKGLRDTVGTIAPMFSSITEAQIAATKAAEANARAVRDLNTAYANTGNAVKGRPQYGPLMPQYGPLMPSDEQHRRALQNRRDSMAGGRNLRKVQALTRTSAGPMMGSRQRRDYKDWWANNNYLTPHSEPIPRMGTSSYDYGFGVSRRKRAGEAMNRFGMSGRDKAINRLSAYRQRDVSAIKWRRGLGAAGGLAMSAGVFDVGGQGDKLMAAGMLAQTATMLPKINQLTAKWAESLAVSAKNSGNIMTALKGGSASMLSLLNKTGPAAIAAAAIASAGFLIYKNIKDAREEAKKLRNEFDAAGELAKELGLSVTDFGLDAAIVSSDEREEMSDEVRSLLETVERVSASDGPEAVDRIFRNLARQWLAGGSTIDEINAKLQDLGKDLNIEIGEITNSEDLAATFASDFTDAINDVMSNWTLDSSFFQSILVPGEFLDAAGDQAAQTLANTVVQGINLAMTQPDGLAMIDSVMADFIQARKDKFFDASGDVINADLLRDFDNQIRQVMGEEFGLEESIIGNMESVEELMQRVLNNIASDKERVLAMSAEEQKNLYSLIDAYGELAIMQRKAAFDANDVATGMNGIARAIDNLLADDGVISNQSVLTMLLEGRKVVDSGDITALSEYRNRLVELAEGLDDSSYEAIRLERAIDGINRVMDMHQERERPSAEYLKELRNRANNRETFAWMAEQRKEKAEQQAQEEAENYNSELRSAIEKERDSVVSAMLEKYDDVTDARIDALEDEKERVLDGLTAERDARLESLEEVRDHELDLIDTTRDRELDSIDKRKDAIDSYLDKLRDMQSYMQDQIDMTAALASGDLQNAAQLQNKMRFASLEEMGEEEKNLLDEQKDNIKEEYDTKEDRLKDYYDNLIDNEKDAFDTRIDNTEDLYETRIKNERKFRNERRSNMERQLAELDKMFLGTEKDWNNFIAKAERITGIKIPRAVEGGFKRAIKNVKKDKVLDDLWENMDFNPFRKGIADAGRQGINDIMKSAYNYVEGGGIDGRLNQIKKDQNSLVPWGSVKHSGGPIGSGPPKDVPILAQTGEFMIQRKAAEKLGPEMLYRLNNAHKYHTGGEISKNPLHNLGHVIGETVAQGMRDGAGVTGPGGPTSGGMPRDQWGGRNWGQVAPNTAAAQRWVKEAFDIKWAAADPNRGDKLSDHSYGKALDIFPGDFGKYAMGETLGIGNAVAEWFRKNLDAFGTKYVIWQNKIANPKYSGNKWRDYNRSGVTQGHYDHVHVSFLHGGGYAGSNPIQLMKGGKLKKNNVLANLHRGETVLRAPVATSLERGIASLENAARGDGGNTVTVQIDKYCAHEHGADELADSIVKTLDKRKKRVNQSRRFN